MSFTSRLFGAAAIAAIALAPTVAFANDDFKVYDTRSEFEAALGASHTTTPGASGVTFATSDDGLSFGSISAPITYAAGASGNLFGSTAGSIGYTYNNFPIGKGALTMTLPSGVSAFGFDYAYNPANAGESVEFDGEFCTTYIISTSCERYESKGLNGGSGFIGIVSSSDIADATIKGYANNLQVANPTFAGSVTATPEPATVALMATGLLALGGMGVARRRRSEG